MTEPVKSESVRPWPPERGLDTFVARDVETLRVLADPLRIRLLEETAEHERTVKELAGILDVPQTRLYYHVRMLEKHDLLRVAGRRMVSGIEERRYAATAKSWTVADDLISDPAVSGLLEAQFDLTRSQLEVALRENTAPPGEPGSNVPILTFTRLLLSQTEIEEIQRRVYELIAEYSVLNPGDGKIRFEAFFGMYRVPGATPIPRAGEGGRHDAS